MSEQKEIGTLVVVVLKAQHLHQPSFYKQNPYAQASLSGLKKRTKVDPKGGQHPVWDDEFRFPVLADAGKDKVNRVLEVSCYKDEQRGEDVLLGKGTVDIEETLKIGEFDGMKLTSWTTDFLQLTRTVLISLDWVPLETSAGARGEVYLEMTFYANAPPPLMRRPSKLNPSDRLVRPAAYFKQGRQSTPTPTSTLPSPQPERSPVTGERNPSQPPPTAVSQIPSSLIPAHGPQSQASGQSTLNGGATSVVTVKLKGDSLPPLPASNDTSDVGSGKNLGLPAALHPGGRNGPRLVPPQNRNRVISTGRPPPEILPDQLHRRSLSDTSILAPLPPSSQLQAPLQAYSPSLLTGARIAPFASPPPPTQEHEPRGVYAAWDYDSFTYGPPSQVYVQPNSQGYVPAPTQGYPRTFSPSQRPMPLQFPLTPPGQPQQLYDASPAVTSPPSYHRQYTQYPSGPPTPQPQQHPHQQPYLPPQQQQYLPPPQQQQQYHSQHLPYTPTPHPPNAPQPYQRHNHPGLAPNSQPPPPPPLQPLYSQTVSPPLLPLSMAPPYLHPLPQQPQQSYFAAPPPPPQVQLQTPQPYFPQLPHQSQSCFSPPPAPPPPPPPPLHGQSGQGPSIPVSVAQPSQTPVPSSTQNQGPIPPPTSLFQSIPPVPPPPQPPTTTPLPSQAVQNTAPGSSSEEAVRQREIKEGQNDTEPVAKAGTVLREERGNLEDVARNQTNEEQCKKVVEEGQGQLERFKDTEEEGAREEREHRQRMEEEDRQRREEELRRQVEEQWKQQEVERVRREEEESKEQEEEEHRRREEEERRRIEDEERRRREEEELRREERRKREEERRRREEELRMREEEERTRREEEECRRQEEERRRQEEERIQREREDAERRRKVAEEEARHRRAQEAEAERRWQEELARIRARAEQEAADAAFARAQMEAEETERQTQEEADLALVRQVQQEVEREESLVQEKRRQEEADMEVARREQAHEEELERRRRRQRMEEVDRELARRLDMELNLSTELGKDQSPPGRAGGGRH
jgi:hypothetical protein